MNSIRIQGAAGALVLALLLSGFFTVAQAQTETTTPDEVATTTAATTTTVVPASEQTILLSLDPKEDLTNPSDTTDKQAVLELLAKRQVDSPGIFTFFAWWVQHSILNGIPVNTIVLVLLLPVLTTLVAFVRVIIGLSSLDMLVPIALAYVLVAVGIVTGGIVLAAVVLAAFVSRMILRRVSIMYFPKRALSMFLLMLSVFGALTVTNSFGFGDVERLSIFPILILALLGDSLVSVQLRKTMSESLQITAVTIVIGLCGFLLATATAVRETLVLYPETLLILIPINLLMGRYFGLRLAEIIRFRFFSAYGSK